METGNFDMVGILGGFEGDIWTLKAAGIILVKSSVCRLASKLSIVVHLRVTNLS